MDRKGVFLQASEKGVIKTTLGQLARPETFLEDGPKQATDPHIRRKSGTPRSSQRVAPYMRQASRQILHFPLSKNSTSSFFLSEKTHCRVAGCYHLVCECILIVRVSFHCVWCPLLQKTKRQLCFAFAEIGRFSYTPVEVWDDVVVLQYGLPRWVRGSPSFGEHVPSVHDPHARQPPKGPRSQVLRKRNWALARQKSGHFICINQGGRQTGDGKFNDER